MKNGFEPDNRYQPFENEPEVKRTYTPEEAGHESRRRPVSRASRHRRRSINPGVVLIAVVFAAVIGLCLYLIISGKNRAAAPADTSYTVDGTDEALVPEDDGRDYFSVKVPRSQMYIGDLILVNSYNEYMFPDEAENAVVSVAQYKNDYFVMADSRARLSQRVLDKFNTLCSDYYAYSGFTYMQINSAYRSRQEQIDIYDQYTRDYGADYAKSYVANPGFSEHHTGLAMDLNVNVNGTINYVESYEGCAWFRDNCKNYGFILRYPKDKVHLTGINYESWHYRYVGVPHAEIITDMNFCLEEYEIYLKDYTYDTSRLLVAPDGTVSTVEADGGYDGSGTQIYYAPADGEETEVKIPKGWEYTLSGNNIDGFVVTATKSGE